MVRGSAGTERGHGVGMEGGRRTGPDGELTPVEEKRAARRGEDR